ncbi:hypothetical protein ROZALSC1DRAFT_31812 [Rozella allomycis CSF55]|uniref:Uncharacterized protein n=1 Tax=Rozella allomycis (strain CSF55) TaxID=988480 RepID=A0A4P9YAF6_ROZAC|nr:hypothetical protein ROZALSC1DRAFT_31812 [Rozella allomycis CSF55]
MPKNDFDLVCTTLVEFLNSLQIYEKIGQEDLKILLEEDHLLSGLSFFNVSVHDNFQQPTPSQQHKERLRSIISLSIEISNMKIFPITFSNENGLVHFAIRNDTLDDNAIKIVTKPQIKKTGRRRKSERKVSSEKQLKHRIDSDEEDTSIFKGLGNISLKDESIFNLDQPLFKDHQNQ